MYNEWPITHVIDIEKNDIDTKPGHDAVFSVSPVIELKATDGYWMALQTEKDYIVLGYDGVKIVNTIPGLDDDSEYYAEERDEDSYETILFKGEHLIDVKEEPERFILKFNHFDMYLYPIEPGQLYYEPDSEYVPIHGYERFIKKKCECGGDAELMLDHVRDFFLRCNRCHRFTEPCYLIQDVFDDWNENAFGDETTLLGSEEFEGYKDRKIRYIALRDDLYPFDDNQMECSSILIAYEDAYFRFSSHRTGVDEYDFDIRKLSGYSKKSWPRRIVASDKEPIIFVQKESWEDDVNMLRLQIGERPILISALDTSLEIGLTHWDIDGNWIEYRDNKLLNDGLDRMT